MSQIAQVCLSRLLSKNNGLRKWAVRSYEIYRNRATHPIDLRRSNRRALPYGFYFDDGKLGLTHVRLMSWLPFDTHIVINGREWLAKDMEKAGID